MSRRNRSRLRTQPPIYPQRCLKQLRIILPSKLARAIRVLAPALVALSFAGVAHAQGTMDFSGATTLMSTFKTTLLKSVREAAEQHGYVVEGFAPTSRAANQLRDAGISADTLQGFLGRVRQRYLYGLLIAMLRSIP